jgi:GH15 family glucan-1,4-alpha-glucosidase
MRDADGYLSLNDYGFIADGYAGALVGSDGAVDWFAAPRLDVSPVCAALLDPRAGGSITLAPTVPYEASQRYVPETMLLQTTFRCAEGVVHVTDALNRTAGRPLSWTELARRIEVEHGEVPMRWQVAPGHRLGTGRAWVCRDGDPPMLEAGDVHLVVRSEGIGTPEIEARTVSGNFSARTGQMQMLAVLVSRDKPMPVPSAASVCNRMNATAEFWRHWHDGIHYDGTHPEQIRRSALVLKALTVQPQEAIAAALTTSLPERTGSTRNFDYRFFWARDHSFALDALDQLDLTEDVHPAVSCILAAIRGTSPDVRSFYLLDGTPAPAEETDTDLLPGYRGSRPVVIGNGAADQLQVDAYGHVFQAVWRYIQHGAYLDPGNASMLADVADHTCDVWRSPDAGIWELGEPKHYTSSKLGAWVALDRAVRLAETGHLPTSRLARWSDERDAVHAWTDEHCWSATKQSYTFYAGTDDLDAATLLAARTGYLNGDDPRLASTIKAVRTELTAGSGDGPLLYRYSGMEKYEGAFLACSFWLVEALALAGQTEEASTLFDQLLTYSGNTGLYAEEVEPETGQLRGNIPQALTHLTLISAATTIAQCQ